MEVKCPACDGTRVSLVDSYDNDRNEIEPCMYCGGKGEITSDEDEREVWTMDARPQYRADSERNWSV